MNPIASFFSRLIVADSGIGMTAEATLVAFGAFSQEAHAVAFKGAGLGIGLTVPLAAASRNAGSA